MNCHCKKLTLVYRGFWLRRTLNSRFVLGEHGGAPEGEANLLTVVVRFGLGKMSSEVRVVGDGPSNRSKNSFSPVASLAEMQQREGLTFQESQWEDMSLGFQWCPLMVTVVSIQQIMVVGTFHLTMSCLRRTCLSVGLILMFLHEQSHYSGYIFQVTACQHTLLNIEHALLDKVDLCVGGTKLSALKWSGTKSVETAFVSVLEKGMFRPLLYAMVSPSKS